MAKVILVAGLAFGDEGKGATVDWLCRQGDGPRTVVRYNGGAQAAHNVVTADGRHHTFSQFGAGTLAGARTHLSKHVLVNPLTLLPEARHLEEVGIKNPHALLTIDREALVTTPYHIALNRLREEARGDGRHGSCGMGIGETVAMARVLGRHALRVADLANHETAACKLAALRALAICEAAVIGRVSTEHLTRLHEDPHGVARALKAAILRVEVVDGAEYARRALKRGERLIFEGAQGVLLDERHGFYPHTTWSNCTFENADRLLDEAGFDGDRIRVGCLRAYHTRHGAGPFPTERADWRPEGEHNAQHAWQGGFRVGHLDGDLVRYAVNAVHRIDEVHLSHVDAVESGVVRIASGHAPLDGHEIPASWSEERVLREQERLGEVLAATRPAYGEPKKATEHVEVIARLCGVSVTVVGRGPRAEDREVTCQAR